MASTATIRFQDRCKEFAVGRTPLIEIGGRFHEPAGRARLFAKAEWLNPGGSVKDRPALRMVLDGLDSGRLGPGGTLLDATSGNTGIAYAWLGARLGFRVLLAVPASVSPARRRILEAYGAELVVTDPLEGSDGAIRRARELQAADPGSVYYPDQYSNPANCQAHYETTAEEIWEQTSGSVTHFVAGLGTSGTFIGTGRRLRELNAAIKLISVEPDSPFHGLEGLKHMGSALVPAIYDASLADEKLSIATEQAQDWVRRLARESGLLVGLSSGAALAGALRVCRRLAAGEGGTVVTVFPDGGERTLDQGFWERP